MVVFGRWRAVGWGGGKEVFFPFFRRFPSEIHTGNEGAVNGVVNANADLEPEDKKERPALHRAVKNWETDFRTTALIICVYLRICTY